MIAPDRTNADAERVSDIVARLRRHALNISNASWPPSSMVAATEAADTIEAQSKALAEAREKLKPFAAVAADYIECGMDHDESVMCGRIPRQGSPQPPVVTFADLRRTLTPAPENPNGRA